jgi:myo-inositol-1(or 4)-monophosphatase
MLKEGLLESVEAIIRQAGEILLSYYHKKLEWYEKKEHGFATQADLAVEKFLIQELSKILPQASFFAEESGISGSGKYCWVIDPLDGTTNFAFGIPYFCISIALTQDNEPILALIFDPLSDDLFCAQKGNGATLNGQKIAVATQRPLEKSLILVGFPYSKGNSFLHVLHNLEQISPRSYAFRHLGAIALDQAYIACARADGLFFENLSWWDVAAGILLIKEAGGKVTTYNNQEIKPGYRSYVAANPDFHGILLSYLSNDLVKDD